MPIKHAAYKHLRQTKKRAIDNRREITEVRDVIKKARRALEAGKSDEVQKLLPEVLKALDKAAEHHVIKPNTAARKKSRLMRHFHAMLKTAPAKSE